MSLNHENILVQLRDALNRNSIKLWEAPYYQAGESNENELKNLTNMLSQQLDIRNEYIYVGICELQNTAIDNLKSIDEFNETGIASLKVRVSNHGGTNILCLKIKLTETAKSLQENIAAMLELPALKIKIIANGKVLDLEKDLLEQGVKNNKQIMAVITEGESNSEDQYANINKIRKEAELLLNNKDSGFLSIEDQSGKSIHLPENERKSIIMALLLHEKGRVQLKKGSYADALILFLEADDELNQCQSHLVKSVDNLALLNLDIVWCYLNLKSILQLPNAEQRLMICEENFKKSYGENLNRVQNIKGSSENERAMIARLQLMKGILYFHQNRPEAKLFLEIAERDIAALKVDEASVNTLMEIGYTKSEAITGLRSSYNSIDRAVNFILERREKFAASRKEGKVERGVKKFLDNLGMNANPRSVITLSQMGFPKELCALALQKCNDDIPQALNLLQNNQNDLKSQLASYIKPRADHIEKLFALGFEKEIAENALKLHVNDFQQALEMLLEMQTQGGFPPELMALAAAAGSSQGSQEAGTSSKTLKDLVNREEAEAAAFEDLKQDLDHLGDDDEYLTVTLDKEEMLLKQYLSSFKK